MCRPASLSVPFRSRYLSWAGLDCPLSCQRRELCLLQLSRRSNHHDLASRLRPTTPSEFRHVRLGPAPCVSAVASVLHAVRAPIRRHTHSLAARASVRKPRTHLRPAHGTHSSPGTLVQAPTSHPAAYPICPRLPPASPASVSVSRQRPRVCQI